jgi:molecular chaperone DnaJ
MADINQAWRTLSDPGRREMYDTELRLAAVRAKPSSSSTTSPSTSGAAAPVVTVRKPPPPQRARFPWRFMLLMVALGVGFVIVNAALTKQPADDKPDNLLQSGSCVQIAPNGDAVEVVCDGPHDGVMDTLLPNASTCPPGTEGHRDRQGMGLACVRMAAPG